MSLYMVVVKEAIGMTYAISDIHGMFEKYESMLKLIGFSEMDELYIIGDVIDRGIDGVKILQDIMKRPNVHVIMGNHELMAKELKEISIRTSDVSLKRQIDERLEWDHSCIENIIDVCQNETHWDEHKIFYADIANVYFDENGNLADYWLKDAEPEFFWNSEERRFEDTYVNIPHPFEDGDIVRIVGTNEVGIVRFPSGLDKEAQNRHMQELVKENFVDYSDSCITVEFIGKNSAFEHKHILPQMLEYIELPDSDFRKKPLEFARKLIQGKCLIQEFQMACEGLV
jgi:hypothetical protein